MEEIARSRTHSHLSHKWVERWEVPNSNGDKNYVVAVSEDWIWGCSCPQWKFRRIECKHIQRKKQEILRSRPKAIATDVIKPQMDLPLDDRKKRILDLTD
jgi:hypothetical protein